MTTITFPARNEIRHAMIAARAMGAAQPMERYSRRRGQCRVTANGNAKGINILFTDGRRLGSVQVAGTVTPAKAIVDEALTPNAVRYLLEASGPEIRIEIGDGDENRSAIKDGSRNEEPARFDQEDGFDAKSYTDVLGNTGNGAAIACNVPRTAALRALREMQKQEGQYAICRLSLQKDGLHAWATDAKLVRPNHAPDAVLARGSVARFEEEIVFGIYRRNLDDTLRTMGGRSIDILVQAPDNPVHLVGTDGREHFVLSTKRLT